MPPVSSPFDGEDYGEVSRQPPDAWLPPVATPHGQAVRVVIAMQDLAISARQHLMHDDYRGRRDEVGQISAQLAALRARLIAGDLSIAPAAPTSGWGWALVETKSGRRLAGRVSEVTIAGAGFLRVDLPAGCHPASQYYQPSEIHAITPCTEEAAVRIAGRQATYTPAEHPPGPRGIAAAAALGAKVGREYGEVAES